MSDKKAAKLQQLQVPDVRANDKKHDMTVYSVDECEYNFNDIEDAVIDFLDEGFAKAGDIVIIYEAEISPLDTKGELINCREFKVKILDDSGDYEYYQNGDYDKEIARKKIKETIKHGTCNECGHYEDDGCPIAETFERVDESEFYCQQFAPMPLSMTGLSKKCGITKTG